MSADESASRSYACPPRTSWRTVIRFWVSVPVLSVQMTVVAPSVPTEGRERISTLRVAMRWVASTSASVSVGSRPSGTIATMMPIAKITAFQTGTPLSRPTPKNSRPIATARIPIHRLRYSTSTRSGETAARGACARNAIFPNSVCIPVANTTARARPDTRDVPASTTLFACKTVSASHGPASRPCGDDSPVTVELSTRTPNASMSRQSAET